ncbi:MAG: BtrH N-terminal domain-containing protein [Chitinophagaceae bacterium]
MKIENFKHIQAAHCENGVTTNLLRGIGIDKMTEPLAFGIGSGLFFVYLPFLKINKGPAIAFRTMPGLIFKRTCNSLNIPVVRKKFSSKESAEKYLQECIQSGQPVGCQVGVYYLTYFPKEYRFHFNAHNIIVYGKEDDRYLVSDPVMENVTSLSGFELERVRFAKGALAPKGQIYYPKEQKIVTDQQLKKAIETGIKRNVTHMIRIPGNIAGVNGLPWQSVWRYWYGYRRDIVLIQE